MDFGMNGNDVPETDHVARYCKGSWIEDGMLQPSAFLLKVGETELSVDWLEFLHPTNRDLQINEMRNIFSNKKYDVSTTARFAVLNVGRIKQEVLEHSPDKRTLHVTHLPAADDPAHCGITGVVQEDELVAELILRAVVSPLYTAKMVRK